jgi:pilus assembly protein CpaE
MVVDDDPQLLRMVGVMLERGNHLPILVSSPTEALARIRDEKPGLVIVDVMMPGLSGHELCAQIRASDDIAGIPILILTARSQSVDRQEALASGADAYMSKPVLPADLMEVLDRLLHDKDQAADAGQHQGMVISLFAMRGGVGRTTLAANLAAGLRRVSRQEVCLVDLSPSGGQAVIHLRLKTRATWDKLPPPNELDWDTLRETLLMHQSGLRVLAAPRRPQLPGAPSAELTASMLAILQRMMRFIVIDLPPIMNPAAQAALDQTDIMLHVVAPDVVSVQVERHAALALARSEHQPPEKIYLLNHIAPEPQLAAEAVENGLRAQLAFNIGYDPNQARALMQGAPLSLVPSSSPLPQTVRQLAEALWRREQERSRRQEDQDQKAA